MQRSRTIRNRLPGWAGFLLLLTSILVSGSVPAHAASKEIIELQTQVQQLLDMVQRLQSTFDQRFTVIQNLAQQTADQANKTTAAVNDLEQKLNTQNDTLNGKLDTSSGQVQSLNDSVDELKSRIAKLDKAVSDLQTQIQNMQAPPATAAPGGTPGAQGADGAQPPGGMPAGGGAPTAPAPAANQAPPLEETFEAAVRDYNAARYQLAGQEFGQVVQFYPLDDLAGTSDFYLGEIAYQQQDYPKAINAYNQVLESFAGNAKAPAAQLHKGLALLAENKRDSGIHELRELIQRHPQTPEARVARSKLNGMSVRINPTSTPAQH
jgi:TolA-binding protein